MDLIIDNNKGSVTKTLEHLCHRTIFYNIIISIIYLTK